MLLGKFVGDQVSQPFVNVIAPKVVVAGGGENVHDATQQLDDRDVERAAAKVIDQHPQVRVITDAITVGQRGGGGFVEDALDRQPRDFPCFKRRLPLHLVEICRHGDHGALHRMAQGLLRGAFHLAQDEG